MSDVDSIKERLTKVESGFEAFKEYFPRILKAELHPLADELRGLKNEVKLMGEAHEKVSLKLSEHSSHMDTIETNIEHRFILHESESKNKSLGLKLWIIGRDAAALTAFCWLLFKEFLSDKIG